MFFQTNVFINAMTDQLLLDIPLTLIHHGCSSTVGYKWNSDVALPTIAFDILPQEEWNRRLNHIDTILKRHHSSFFFRRGLLLLGFAALTAYLVIALTTIGCTDPEILQSVKEDDFGASFDYDYCAWDARTPHLLIWFGSVLGWLLICGVVEVIVWRRNFRNVFVELIQALGAFTDKDQIYQWTLHHWYRKGYFYTSSEQGFIQTHVLRYDMLNVRVYAHRQVSVQVDKQLPQLPQKQ